MKKIFELIMELAMLCLCLSQMNREETEWMKDNGYKEPEE
jgi:hypothetical protein